MAKSFRVAITHLFITVSKPYRPASKDTPSRWIKSVLHDVVIDMEYLHHTRQD